MDIILIWASVACIQWLLFIIWNFIVLSQYMKFHDIDYHRDIKSEADASYFMFYSTFPIIHWFSWLSMMKEKNFRKWWWIKIKNGLQKIRITK